MKLLLAIFLFSSVLFVYLHVIYHLKTSDDLQVLEIDNVRKSKLHEICDLRQPALFSLEHTEDFTSLMTIERLSQEYGSFDVNVYNDLSTDEQQTIPVMFNDYLELSNTNDDDTKPEKYITRDNSMFLEETTLEKAYKSFDNIFRPIGICHCKYDIMLSKSKTWTRARYEDYYRNFLIINQGKCRIKLVPPKYKKHMDITKDFANYEFYSKFNLFNIQQQYKIDFNKIKVLELELHQGQVLYIPSNWIYMIEFPDTNTSLSFFKYYTFMNLVAISPDMMQYYLQQKNIKLNMSSRL